MGKISSKHEVCKRTAPEGECFLVNTRVASVKDLMDAINSRDCLSEAFVELSGSKQTQQEVAGQENPTIELTTDFMSCCGKPDSKRLFDHHLRNIPIRVTLPPLTKETDLLKLLTVDRMQEDGSDGIQTDTTDNNHGSEKAEQSQDNECGITVEANTGPELQEWHFTLYDFDDLGKITKADIAGLLKSLYDTVGSVITLQQQGTRVLKLHLTVSPDQGAKCPEAHDTKGNGCSVQEHQFAEGTKSNNSAFRSVAGEAPFSSKRPSRPTRCALVHHGSPRTPHHKTVPDRQPVCSRDKRPDVNSSDRKDGNDLLLTRQLSFFSGQGISDAATAGTTSGANVRRRHQQQQQQQWHQCSGSSSKRPSQFDERHLAELIQKNMSLNDQHPQHSRRNRRHHSIFVNKIQAQDHSPTDRTCTNGANDYANEESAQCRNYYLDLAGIENYTTSKPCELTSSARPSCNITGAQKGMKLQKPAKLKSKLASSAVKNFEHCNSARTDALGTGTICEEDEVVTSNVFMAARQEPSHSCSPLLNPKFPDNLNVSQSNPAPNDVETISSSHYRRRHRHREKNQSRAMKQVAEWIEKEHIYHKSEKRVVVVQRHEHHHVHEHFHHHFHHCSHT